MTDIENKSLKDAEQKILSAIGQIKFGAVEVHIHDGRIVQIEERIKTRF